MLVDIIFFIFSLSILAVASLLDLRTREVPDSISYSFIIGVLGISALYSFYGEFYFFLYSLAGAVIFFIFAYLLYRAKQMGGADVKLLVGIGALFANNTLWGLPLPVVFLFLLLGVATVYTAIWAFVLYLKNFSRANKKFCELLAKKKIPRLILIIIAGLAFVSLFFIKGSFLRLGIASGIVIVTSIFYLIILIRVLEDLYFIKKVPVEQLTEGDWLAKDVYKNGKCICSANLPCLEKKHIQTLKEMHVQHVFIKVGIPFVPALFLATICTYSLFFLF